LHFETASLALATTHGLSKADLMAERLLAINPNLKLHVIKEFLTPPKVEEILANDYDYVVDAIDSISPKIRVLVTTYRRRLKLISSMGAGGKLDPTQVRIVDIGKTYNCRLAQQVRKILKKHNIRSGFKAVFSPELARREWLMYTDGSNYKKSAYGTMSYMPAVFGCCCASAVIRGLIDMEK
jgi:tRNA A37 threonylcarbamoyladenosine dehydratase